MNPESQSANKTVDATVIDSSVIDEEVFLKVIKRAGRIIAKPAFEAMEMLIDPTTPAQARVTMIAALTYLLVPIDLMPDFIPVAGFSDDLVALTAALSVWSNNMTPAIRRRAELKLDKWFPIIR